MISHKKIKIYTLNTLHKNDKAQIIKIVDKDSKLLNFLATLSLLPKAIITVVGKAHFSGPIMVKVNNSTYALGNDIAKLILVKKI